MRPFFVAAALLAVTLPLVAQQPSAPRRVTVSVDLASVRTASQPIYGWFGYDEANYTTTPHGRDLLRELHDLSPVPIYIRAHHLLTSGDGTPELKWSSTGVYREDSQGNPHYDFKILDGIFDAYQQAGVRPMVELGFMPKDLAATLPNRHEPYQVHFPQSTISGGSNNPPRDYARWRELVRVVTAHLVQRYGADTVRQWPFEVWNEPDIDYWHATPEEYWRLYDFAVAGVRAALPGAQVGGPASTSPRNGHARKFLDDFLTHVESGKSAATGGAVPFDFLSFHAKGQPTFAEGRVTMGLQQELQDADQGFRLVASHPRLRHLPVILSEADPEGCAACSSKSNPANNYRNGTLYPAYTATAYKALLDLAARYQVHLVAMLSWSFEFEGQEAFGGFRDLSTDGVDKPILNLFRMLGLVQGERLAVSSTGALSLDRLLEQGVSAPGDVDGLATTDHRGASVLLWNYADAANATQTAEVKANVSGLPPDATRVLVTEYRIDTDHSNAYTAWQAMGSPSQPTEAQLTLLKAHAGLELFGSPAWQEARKGQVHIAVDLPPHSISLLQFGW